MKGARFREIDRMSMHLPLRVTRWIDQRDTDFAMHPRGFPEASPEVEYTVTENVCPGGCYFFLMQEPTLGSRLEMEITIPGEVHDIPFARIYCRGEVIRVDRGSGEAEPHQARFGVAATIERLQDVCLESIPRPADHATGGGDRLSGRVSTGEEQAGGAAGQFV